MTVAFYPLLIYRSKWPFYHAKLFLNDSKIFCYWIAIIKVVTQIIVKKVSIKIIRQFRLYWPAWYASKDKTTDLQINFKTPKCYIDLATSIIITLHCGTMLVQNWFLKILRISWVFFIKLVCKQNQNKYKLTLNCSFQVFHNFNQISSVGVLECTHFFCMLNNKINHSQYLRITVTR